MEEKNGSTLAVNQPDRNGDGKSPSITVPQTAQGDSLRRNSSGQLSRVLSRNKSHSNDEAAVVDSLAQLSQQRTLTDPQKPPPPLFSLEDPAANDFSIRYDIDLVAVHSYGERKRSAWRARVPLQPENQSNGPERPGGKRRFWKGAFEAMTQGPTVIGDPHSTQPAQGLNYRDIYWLTDGEFLPKGAKTARVLLFEYREPPDDPKPPSIQSVTKELSERLLAARSNFPLRPILFIGRDFGITVIERTLIDAWKVPSAKSNICMATAGVAFFATPGPNLKGTELEYFDVSHDRRLGLDRTRTPYMETKIPAFISQHLTDFREFAQLLEEERSAMTLRCFISDAKFQNNADITYCTVLKTVTDIQEQYPVLRSASEGNEILLRELLKNGRNPNIQNSSGQSPLHLAIRKGYMQVIRVLIEGWDADVRVADCKGQTPLHLAMIYAPENRELMELLFQRGGDINLPDFSGKTALSLAKENRVDPSILRMCHLFQGPSEDTVEEGIKSPTKPKSSHAVYACRHFRSTLAEFHIINRKEQFIRTQPTVQELLYERGGGPIAILNAIRRPEMTEPPRCRWIHLPANNVAWVDDLFAKMSMAQDPLTEDQHEGPTPWSHYMRPQARAFRPLEYTMDHNGNWKSADVPGKHIVLFMPFLNYERACDSNLLQEAVRAMPSADYQPRTTPQILDDVSGKSKIPRLFITVPEPSQLKPHPEEQSPNPSTTGAATTQPNTPQSQTNSQTLLLGQVDYPILNVDPENLRRLELERNLIRGYLYETDIAKISHQKQSFLGPLHVRRTLDQSHYFMLKDTSRRDKDQVVLRGARKPGRQRMSAPDPNHLADFEEESGDDEPIYDKSETHPMVIVDQLWLWVINETVITSFPQKWTREGDVLDVLLQYLRVDKKRAPIHDAQDLVNIIIEYCVGVFNRPRSTSGLGLHNLFESAVGSVADKETKLFRKFEEAAKEDPTIPNEKKGASKLLDGLFDIKKEVKLLEETKDIKDELRMILRILNDQALVISDMASALESNEEQINARLPHSPRGGFRKGIRKAFKKMVKPEEPSPHQVITTFTEGDVEAPMRSDVLTVGAYKERHPIIDANIRDFNRMLSHATASYEAIDHLLDYKQKHINATEARFARKEAQETVRQGNTIMFFTIVTIIFGSLSFVTTFFALNVTVFPKDSNNDTVWKLGHIVGYVAGISVGIALPFVLIAFAINPILELSKWWEKQKEPKAKSAQ